jgi:hypothetical protein
MKARPPPLSGAADSSGSVEKAVAHSPAASPPSLSCSSLPPKFMSQVKRDMNFGGSKSTSSPLAPGGAVRVPDSPFLTTPLLAHQSGFTDPPERPRKIMQQGRFADSLCPVNPPGTPIVPQSLDPLYDASSPIVRKGPFGFPHTSAFNPPPTWASRQLMAAPDATTFSAADGMVKD